MPGQSSRAGTARRETAAQRRDRRTRAAFRARRRRAVPRALAAILGSHCVVDGALSPDPGRGPGVVELTVTGVRAVAEQLGHRLDHRQAAEATAVLVEISISAAPRRALLVDDVDRDAVSWAVSTEAWDQWTEAARRGGRGAAA